MGLFTLPDRRAQAGEAVHALKNSGDRIIDQQCKPETAESYSFSIFVMRLQVCHLQLESGHMAPPGD